MARIRVIGRRLPRNGVMLFIDIKPIAVKAYGGRRYTSAQRLVLERRQKTRGFFYLFTLYDVKQGRVRWAFSAKSQNMVAVSCTECDNGIRPRKSG